MKIVKNVALVVLFLFGALNAVIHETDTLIDILRNCQRCLPTQECRPLVIVDLDNTIIRALTEEATDEWFCAEAEKLIQKGVKVTQAWDLVLTPYTEAQCKTKVRFVEDCALEVFSFLRTQKIRTIALTSRGRPDLIAATFRQFAQLGITFEQEEPAWQQIFTLAPLPRETQYKNGVIFCDGNNKAKSLARALEIIDYQPTDIIFIDDSLGHLLAVEQFARQRNINFTGLHYLRVKHGLLDHPSTFFDASLVPATKPEIVSQ